MEHQPFGKLPPPLDYRTPAYGRPIFSMGALVGMLSIGFVVTMSLIVTDRFEETFKDFHTDLPEVTKLLLIAARIFLRGFGWIFLVAAIVVVPFVWAAVFPSPADASQRRLRRAWLRLVMIVTIALWVLFVVVALFAPMISLVQTVSTPAKH